MARRAEAVFAAMVAAVLALTCLAPCAAYAKNANLGVSIGSGIPATATFEVRQQDIKNTALSMIRECRQDALDDTRVTIGGMTMREWLDKFDISEEEYLNPAWSNSLERIAIQRAAESNILFEHKRPGGDNISSAKYEGAFAGGEILAGAGSIEYSMSLWMSEKEAFIESGGVWASNTGHYMTLIHPNYTGYGFGSVGGCCAGEALGGDTTIFGSADQTNLQGDYEIEIALPESAVTASALTPSVTSVGVGKSVKVTASLSYKGKEFALDATFSSKDPGVARVSGSVVTGVKAGSTTITMTASGITKSFKFTVGDTKTMHRLYNRWTGEHFYTSDVGEKNNLLSVGWTDEGTGWLAPDSGTPVYRLYNPYVKGGDHHYTTSESERDACVVAGWRYEGVGWYSAPEKGGVPLYRQYNPYASTGIHNYTTSKEENDYLVSVGWRAEGVAWYGVNQ